MPSQPNHPRPFRNGAVLGACLGLAYAVAVFLIGESAAWFVSYFFASAAGSIFGIVYLGAMRERDTPPATRPDYAAGLVVGASATGLSLAAIAAFLGTYVFA